MIRLSRLKEEVIFVATVWVVTFLLFDCNTAGKRYHMVVSLSPSLSLFFHFEAVRYEHDVRGSNVTAAAQFRLD